MRISSRRLLLLLVILGIVVFLLYRSSALLHLSSFSGTKVLDAIREAKPFGLILSLIAIYGCYALRALRWQVFQRNLGPSRFWTIYKLTLAGFSAVFLLGRAGEPVRPLLLASKEKLPVADMFGIYVLERILDFASMAAITAIGLMLFRSHRQFQEAGHLETAAQTAGLLLSVGVAAAIVFLLYLRLHGTAFLERRLQGWLGAQGWRAGVARIVLGFTRGVQAIQTWGQLGLAVVYSVAHWFLVALIYLWISQSFVNVLGPIHLGGAMLVLAFTLVGSAVQLPGVGGGSQAGTILAYTAIFGVETEAAVAVALVVWLITFAGCSLAGVPILIREGWSFGKLREMAKHENEVIDAAVAEDAKPETRQGEQGQ